MPREPHPAEPVIDEWLRTIAPHGGGMGCINALRLEGYAVVARKDLGLHVKKLDGAGFQDWVSPEIRAATKEKVE